MRLHSCPQQQQVAQAVRLSQWPNACDPELRSHVEACRECQDFVLVAQTLQQTRQATLPLATITPPGLIWWRAQLRRRNSAIEKAVKPVLIMEGLALLATVITAIAMLWQFDGIRWLRSAADSQMFQQISFLGMTCGGSCVWALWAAAAGSIVLVSGFLLYFAARSE